MSDKKLNVQDFNIGDSDYSAKKIQPWDIWMAFPSNPWVLDIVKRLLRTKSKTDSKLDLEKIGHIYIFIKANYDKITKRYIPTNLMDNQEAIKFLLEVKEIYNLSDAKYEFLSHLLLNGGNYNWNMLEFLCNEIGIVIPEQISKEEINQAVMEINKNATKRTNDVPT